jgi:hypothetical protein
MCQDRLRVSAALPATNDLDAFASLSFDAEKPKRACCALLSICHTSWKSAEVLDAAKRSQKDADCVQYRGSHRLGTQRMSWKWCFLARTLHCTGIAYLSD